MLIDRSYLIRIVENASSMAERLTPAFTSATPVVEASVAGRLDRWRALVAGDNRLRFERRLHWDGLDDVSVRRAIGPAQWQNGRPLPPWTTHLGDALQKAAQPAPRDRAVRPDLPCPFEDVLLPFVAAARERVRARAGTSADALTDGAHGDLERGLLERLSNIADQTLYAEFAQFRLQQRRTPLDALTAAIAGGGRSIYDRFVADLTAARGLERVCLRYPVLARLLASRAAQWEDATCEFLARLHDDRDRIADTLGVGNDRVTAVTPNLSDSHRGGRTVSLVRFASGQTIVYKPRNLQAERDFYALIAWLNDGRLALPLRVLNVVDRGTHGWAEFVPSAPCHSREEAERYYVRAGMLLCVAYALGGSDLHAGNVIASADHPVFVDLEVMFRSAVRRDRSQHLSEGRAEGTGSSVLDTGFLPLPQLYGGAAYADGGLMERSAVGEFERPGWRHVNTDLMAPDTVTVEATRVNAAVLSGVPCRADDYLSSLTTGFQQMYNVLLRCRPELLAADGPLAVFRRTQVRVVLRNTRAYASVLQHALHPQFLQDGAERSIELDVFKAIALRQMTRPRSWPMLTSEHDELEQLDVPVFMADASGCAVSSSGGEQANLLYTPGFDAMQRRLAALGPQDLQQQLHVMRTAIESSSRVRARAEGWARCAQPERLGRADAIVEARGIVDALERSAVASDRGGVSWLGANAPFDPADSSLTEVGLDLYRGRTGMAMFFAAFARVAGDQRAARLAEQALAPFRATSGRHDRWERLLAELGPGGSNGLGGVIYALVRLSRWLGRDCFLDEARHGARLLTPDVIARDTVLDVYGGTAGTLLGLLALHRACGEDWIRHQAEACGRHLLATRRRDPVSGHHAWGTLDGRLMSGFAHGAAGIACALSRLAPVAGDDTYRAAAVEAHAFERTLLRSDVHNWLEYHDPDEPAGATADLWCTWCRGSAGIGLARLGGAPMRDAAAGADVDAAIQSTIASTPAAVEHLCCGNLGRADFLLAASRHLGRADLRAHALEIGDRVMRRARVRGSHINGFIDVLCPGLFQGVTGIGYQLLRLHHAQLPSVLAWR